MSLSRRAAARVIAVSTAAAFTGPAVALPASAATDGRGGHPETAESKKTGGPLVRHTGKGPTGYEVTFRYHAPKARRVQLKGEWYFERPSTLTPRPTTPDQVAKSQGLRPEQ